MGSIHNRCWIIRIRFPKVRRRERNVIINSTPVVIGLLLSTTAGIVLGQSVDPNRSPDSLNGTASGGVSISWQPTIPPVPTVINVPTLCLEITPDIDKNTLIAANRCNRPVTLLGIRDTSPMLGPFAPTAQKAGREFTTVTVPQNYFAELIGQNIAAYYFVPMYSSGFSTAPPDLRCLVEPAIGQTVVQGSSATEPLPIIACDVSGKGLGDGCSCPNAPSQPAHIVIALPVSPQQGVKAMNIVPASGGGTGAVQYKPTDPNPGIPDMGILVTRTSLNGKVHFRVQFTAPTPIPPAVSFTQVLVYGFQVLPNGTRTDLPSDTFPQIPGIWVASDPITIEFDASKQWTDSTQGWHLHFEVSTGSAGYPSPNLLSGAPA